MRRARDDHDDLINMFMIDTQGGATDHTLDTSVRLGPIGAVGDRYCVRQIKRMTGTHKGAGVS